jgi:hypothetical protein
MSCSRRSSRRASRRRRRRGASTCADGSACRRDDLDRWACRARRAQRRGSRGVQCGERCRRRGTHDESARRHPADDTYGRGVVIAIDLRPRREQARRGDAGVREDTRDAPAALGGASLELSREEAEGDLRLAVGALAVVRALPLRVVPVHATAIRGDADLGDDAGLPRLEQRQQLGDESDLAEMIGAELQLEPVGGRPTRGRRHHARVVDEEADGHSSSRRVSPRAHRRQRRGPAPGRSRTRPAPCERSPRRRPALSRGSGPEERSPRPPRRDARRCAAILSLPPVTTARVPRDRGW